jgi:hypothetical protein
MMYQNLRFWVHVYIFAAPIQINNNIMTVFIIIVAIVLIFSMISIANKQKQKEQSEAELKSNTERKKQEIEAYLEEQKKEEENPQTESEPDEEEPSDFDGLDYEEKMKALAKQCENLLFETVSSLEMTRAEKVQLIPEILSSIEQHPDETKILKAVVRKLFKTLIDRTPDLMKRVDYQERFDEEKEELRSRDYVVIDSQWNQFLDDFDDLKADLEALQEKPQPKPQRSFGISTMETRTDEVDGQPCLVANFAVKGLFFRSPEDQDAARTLKVGDPLHMEHEEGNEKDPNAMKVTMADGHHIGYVDSKCSGYVRENQPRLLKFVVSKVDDYGDPPYIYAEAFFKNE